MQLLLQFFMNISETLQTSFPWSVVVHVTLGFSSENLFLFGELSHFSASEDCLSMYLVCTTPLERFETMQASSF